MNYEVSKPFLHSEANQIVCGTTTGLIQDGYYIKVKDLIQEDATGKLIDLLHDLIRQRDANTTARLIDENCININTLSGRTGENALHVAVNMQSLDMLRFLLSFAHANVEAPTSATAGGYTPLHLAAKTGNLEIALLLIKKGANPNALSARKQTPLMVIAQQPKSTPTMPRLGDTGTRRWTTSTVSGLTTLGGLGLSRNNQPIPAAAQATFAAQNAASHGVIYVDPQTEREIKMLRLLVAYGADPNLRDDLDLDAFQMASARCKPQFLAHLHACAAELANRERSDQATPTPAATAAGSSDGSLTNSVLTNTNSNNNNNTVTPNYALSLTSTLQAGKAVCATRMRTAPPPIAYVVPVVSGSLATQATLTSTSNQHDHHVAYTTSGSTSAESTRNESHSTSSSSVVPSKPTPKLILQAMRTEPTYYATPQLNRPVATPVTECMGWLAAEGAFTSHAQSTQSAASHTRQAWALANAKTLVLPEAAVAGANAKGDSKSRGKQPLR